MLAFRVQPEVDLPPGATGEEEVRSALAQRDRRAALEAMMRAYGDEVFRFCVRALGDEALADDVLQQSFAEAWEGLPRFEQRSSARVWLFGIVVHRCRDAVRGRQRFAARFEIGAAPEETRDPMEPADERAARAAIGRVLLACLGQLAPEARTAVVLRCVDEFGYREMAEICGEKAGTLQARVVRALPVLRRCLGRKGVNR